MLDTMRINRTFGLASQLHCLPQDHAVEGMRHVGPDHPHAIMAAKGLERFLAVLRRWPKDIETRQATEFGSIVMEDLLQLQLATWQSYFYPASVIYGLSHQIGHILGGSFRLPHSMTSCITLAPVVRACAAHYGSKLAIFTGGRVEDAAFNLAESIETSVASLGLPSRITFFEFESSKITEVGKLLRKSYAEEVNDLGEGADLKLDRLLESSL